MNTQHRLILQLVLLIVTALGGYTQANAQAPLPGRLFTTPAERLLLEQMRRRGEQGVVVEETRPEFVYIEQEENVRPPPPNNVELNFGGSVTRRDGTRTLWINGESVNEGSLPAGMKVVQHGHLTAMQIQHKDNTFLILPGQRFHLASGVISNIILPSNEPVVVPPTGQQAGSENDEQSAEAAADASAPNPASEIAILATLRTIMEYMQ
ncbi:MAG: hypothetical protein Q7L07_05130 [Pseudohongiella sp.]|nr:hypothetical protein [Pseudohongiella sp.]MDP1756058.1 hypothetical protein [Pseudohongiella sp.]